MDKIFVNIIIIIYITYVRLLSTILGPFFCFKLFHLILFTTIYNYYKLFHFMFFWLCEAIVGFFCYWRLFHLMLLLVILCYVTIDYLWLFYWCLLLVIVLMAINGY
jgi:hypothetical protein